MDTTVFPSPVFFDYESVAAWLTSMGSAFGGEARLVNRTTRATIGRWAWVDSAIRPVGPINFAAVTTTPHAVIASVDSPTQVTLTAGHNLTSGLCRIMDVSAGTEAYDGVQVTVVGNTATMVSTATLAAGDTVHRTGVSELSIGGATRAVVLPALSRAQFVGTALRVRYGARIPMACSNLPKVRYTPGRDAAANGQYSGAGWYSGALSIAGVASRPAGADLYRVAYGNPAAPTVGGLAAGSTLAAAWAENITEVLCYNAVANEMIALRQTTAGARDGYIYATGGGAYSALVPAGIIIHARPAAAEDVWCDVHRITA